MRRTLALLLLILANVDAAAAQTFTPPPDTVLIDRDMSPAAGATVTIAFGRLVARVEDRFVLWHQPEWGGEVTATADHRIGTVAHLRAPLSLVVQGGYKTNGFLGGEPIHEGGALRVGMAVHP